MVRIAVTDDDGGSTESDVTITVTKEDAIVAFGSENPVAIEVTGAGSDESVPFTLYAYVREAPESGLGDAAGDINLAEVALMLEPVGPGGPIEPVACTSTGVVAEFDYEAILEVACDVSGIPVNAYVATVSIVGDYYQGNTNEDVVVYDPSLGFTTGGGWFAWPGTGERTTFGYTMKYNRKGTSVQGNMVLIRHTADGDRYRIKSNALFGLALGETSDTGWATFLGKATYLEPGMDEAVGNHAFTVYVEDRGEPGAGTDRFWLEVRDKDGVLVDLSFDRPAGDHAVVLGGGNIVVPHKPIKVAKAR
jgi:hypothetical protein